MRQRIRLTRRDLLLGASRLALLAVAGRLVSGEVAADEAAWSDGTSFDDGTGWTG